MLSMGLTSEICPMAVSIGFLLGKWLQLRQPYRERPRVQRGHTGEELAFEIYLRNEIDNFKMMRCDDAT